MSRPLVACGPLAVILAVILAWGGVAVADDAPPEAPTRLTGRVTDVLGKPITGARVHVLAMSGGQEETRTDKTGRYTIDLETVGAHAVVIAADKLHTYRRVLVQRGATTTLDIEVEYDTEGSEVIKIVDPLPPPPAVKAKPRTDPRATLPYSEEAVERDAWARAWLLLDVDPSGKVTRLKLLKPPGYDLDRIAIEEAFKLTFEPALDAAGKPQRTYVVYTMEWPSWGWLVQGNGTALRKPNDVNELEKMGEQSKARPGGADSRPASNGDTVTSATLPPRNLSTAQWARPTAMLFQASLSRVPCAGSGPLNLDLRNRAYRDCSGPNLDGADRLPWITRQTIDEAVADLHRDYAWIRQQERMRPRPTRVPDLIAAGITAGFLVATVVAYYKFDQATVELVDNGTLATTDPARYADLQSGRDRWAKASMGLAGGFVLSGAVTVFLWQRDAKRSSFSVQPTPGGASAAFSTRF